MTSQEERAREVLAEHCGSTHGLDESAAIAAMLALAAEVREDAAKVVEGWRDPCLATDHENRSFANIAAAIRAQGGAQ